MSLFMVGFYIQHACTMQYCMVHAWCTYILCILCILLKNCFDDFKLVNCKYEINKLITNFYKTSSQAWFVYTNSNQNRLWSKSVLTWWIQQTEVLPEVQSNKGILESLFVHNVKMFAFKNLLNCFWMCCKTSSHLW